MPVLSGLESVAGITDTATAQSSTDTSVAAASSQAAISSASADTSSSALSSSDTSTTSASATTSISATSTSATSSTTASTGTSSTTTSSSSSSSTTTEAGTTSPGTDTQTLTSTQLFTSDTPSSSASAATSSSASFFQNKGAVAGVFTVIGLVAAIILVYLITRVLRRRRQRQLDREMDAVSFVPASLQAIVDDDDDAGPRHLPSLDLSSGSHGAQSGYSGASYSQPPLPMPQQQHNYGFAQRDYASSEYSNAGAAGVGAARGLPPALTREPQMVQPQRAMVRQMQPVQADTGLAHKTSQSATVYNAADPSGPLPTGDYLSNYSSPPASGESEYLSPTTEIPLSPPLPNPYGGDEKPQRVLKVANE